VSGARIGLRWDEFAAACPELATLGEVRLRQHELCLLGTIRKDGSPRISPCELEFAAGHLLLGMMWQSRKALDLLRDPRCAVHSCVSDRLGAEGDFKLYGQAIDVHETGLREAYRDAIRARIDWAPDEPDYHLFALDIASAAFMIFGDERYGLAWNPERGLRRWTIPAD
jgi:Pyridoxamine 5'-phosphate oxidase